MTETPTTVSCGSHSLPEVAIICVHAKSTPGGVVHVPSDEEGNPPGYFCMDCFNRFEVSWGKGESCDETDLRIACLDCAKGLKSANASA